MADEGVRSAPPPPAVGNSKVRQLLNELIPTVLQLVLIIVVGVVPEIKATAVRFHAKTERLYRLPEIFQGVRNQTQTSRNNGARARLLVERGVQRGVHLEPLGAIRVAIDHLCKIR